MSILDRYILRESLLFFLITLIVFTGILLTVRMLQFAALIINKGVSPGYILDVFLAIVPTFLEIAIPMAALLGVMLAIARMSGDSEIVVMRASGISLLRLLKPVLILAVLSCAVSFYIAIVLRPWGYAKLSQSLFEIAQSRSTAGLTPGVFNRLGKITLYAEAIDDTNGNLSRVLIDDKRNPEARRVIFADSGRITSDSRKRNIAFVLNDGYIHEILSKNYALTNFDTNSLLVDVDEINQSGDGGGHDKRAREMHLPEIRENVSKFSSYVNQVKTLKGDFDGLDPELKDYLLKENVSSYNQLKRKLRRFKSEAGRRFSMPFATFILAMLGLPLGIFPPRAHKTLGVGLSVSVGLVVFTVYYVLLSLGITFGEAGKIDVNLGLWIPNLTAILITCYVTYKIASEQWPSIATPLEPWGSKISRIFRRN